MKKFARLACEALESRDNPSVAIVGSDIVVTGTAGHDVIRVQALTSPNVSVIDNGVVTVLALPPGGHVIVDGLAGRDLVQLSGNVSGELYGGTDKDTITGGSGDDVIRGGDGDDFLQGGVGNDALIGGSGVDIATSGSGSDVLVGGEVVGYGYSQMRQAVDDWANLGITDPLLVLVIVDAEFDRLTGGSQGDWFVAQAADSLPDYVSPPDAWSVV